MAAEEAGQALFSRDIRNWLILHGMESYILVLISLSNQYRDKGFDSADVFGVR